jgi:short subunit dehydrogenase-like uncharacterized protein
MSIDKPVVVYGASGYTGRLICEYLREFNVLFIAAVRDKWAGFASGCQAFGHRELLGVLRSFGLVMQPVLTTAH